MRDLVLGIGSPFADDQIGWLIAEQLARMPKLQERLANGRLQVLSADRPGLNLLHYLNTDFQRIILIDMVKARAKLGALYRLKAAEIMVFKGMLSTHSLGVAKALALADALALDISRVVMWGIVGTNHRPEQKLHLQVLATVAGVCDEIAELVLS